MNTNRIEYISLASVLSTIAVVYLHTNACFWNFSISNYWFTANIIESVFYFAVPIFFMISGAMLIDFNKKYDLKEFFKKRISKTVIPYIIWSLVGFLLGIFYVKTDIVDLNQANLYFTIIKGLFTGSLVPIYWFFIPLFVTYLFIPIFALIPDDKKKNIFIVISSLIFILSSLIPFIILVFNLQLNYPIHFNFAGNYLFFTLTGYLLHRYELSKKYRIILYLLAIIGLSLHMFGTCILSIQAGEIIKTYKQYTNVPTILYSLGIFVFIKYDLVKLMRFKLINSLVNFLDYYTFGIYLIHLYLLEFLIKTFHINLTSLGYRLFLPIIILMMSVVVIHLIRKIPVIRKILP